MLTPRTAAVDLYWIALGAGGQCVRFNGLVFEAIQAARSYRRRCDPYHAALVIGCDGEDHTIEIAPSPDADGAAWGRDELQAGEMWNSNSLIAWLICSAGVSTRDLRPPPHGRAPGWQAGLDVARRGPSQW